MRLLLRLLGLRRCRAPVDHELRVLLVFSRDIQKAFLQAEKSGLHVGDTGGLACQIAGEMLTRVPNVERRVIIHRWKTLLAHAARVGY